MSSRTVAQLISFLQDNYGREDKPNVWLQGINWTKNRLCDAQMRTLKKLHTVQLVNGTYKYPKMSTTTGETGLPSDYHMLASMEVFVAQSDIQKYLLSESTLNGILRDTTTTGYPTAMHISGDHDLYVGNPVNGTTDRLELQIYTRPADYAIDATTVPVFADIVGDDIYIFGACRIMGNHVQDVQWRNDSNAMFLEERARLHKLSTSHQDHIVRSSELFRHDKTSW